MRAFDYIKEPEKLLTPEIVCIFRRICASVPKERSAIPL